MRMTRFRVLSAILGSVLAVARLQAQAVDARVGGILIPASSLERPGDAGTRLHTNHRILLSTAYGNGPGGGMTPAQILAFYGMPATGKGGHGVIAIVDAYDYPTALADFNTFSNYFNLVQEPSASATASTNTVFQVVYAGGARPAGDGGWSQEAALDIEWAHAMAPAAKIVLVEAASSSFADLFAAVDVAAALPGVACVSMSWASSEFPNEHLYDNHFNRDGPLFFASSGDAGGVVTYPSCSPYVVAVGGTSVATDRLGDWIGESAWTEGGGGDSFYLAKPVWQGGVGMTGAKRGVPDISSDADPGTGVAVFDSTAYQGYAGWMVFGGTSVSCPCVAGMVNLAGAACANTTQLLSRIYGNALEGPSPLRDITSGDNGFPALVGWDYATGVGAPAGAASFAPPTLTAAITTPAAGTTVVGGGALAFAGSATGGVEGSAFQFAWAFGDGANAIGSSSGHVFSNPGTTSRICPVTLTVTDSNGLSASTTMAITVARNTLAAAISQPPAAVAVASGTAVAFLGTAADSSAAATFTYAWDFGDGTPGTGISTSHSFTNMGTTPMSEVVTLTVKDSSGVKATATRLVTVASSSLVAAIVTPASAVTVASGTALAFLGTATDQCLTATITSYAWSFGDGASGTGAAASHAFYNPGATLITEPVTFTVTDSAGLQATAACTVSVTPNVVSVAISTPPTSVTVASGASVAFLGTATDSAAAVITFAWDFGDGATATGAFPSHVFTNPGNASIDFLVTLTATDSSLIAARATRTVTVTGVDISVRSTSVGVLVGAVAMLSANVSGAADGSILWTGTCQRL